MIDVDYTNPYELAKYIRNSKKITPVKAYINGNIKRIDFNNLNVYKSKKFAIVIGNYAEVEKVLEKNKSNIKKYDLETLSRNSAVPLLDIQDLDARIEYGAIVRKGASIGKSTIIMMGAVINIGAQIGDNTMIDMNAVIGARGIIGKNVHIGAGAVVAGILEPPSKEPVIIEDDVIVGANAVILEGVKVGKGAVVGAGAIVTKDVETYTVVVGNPARKVKERGQIVEEKVEIMKDLRGN